MHSSSPSVWIPEKHMTNELGVQPRVESKAIQGDSSVLSKVGMSKDLQNKM